MWGHVNEGRTPAARPESESDQVKQLQERVSRLEQAVDANATIDQACGVLVAVGRMTPAEAWDLMRETSMRTSIKLRHVAELIVDWGTTGRLPAEIRGELDRHRADPTGSARH
ncbi:ANTAR domain-containing protein [Streptomyces sp. NPDC008313]|uniref:ANTAR domain-containing protein n=1 Tax=Streptomyces sp. NPDC008313 TaxID=3364826 RepID=UPI0036E5D870